jgi:hypothetical protein
MNPVLVAFALVAIAVLGAGVVSLRLRRRSRRSSVATWNGSFDIRRYRPMERLRADDDLTYLTTLGLDQRTMKQFRRERRRLFGRYLRNLQADFWNLHAAARALLIEAPADRPELAAAILRQQFAFQRTVWTIRLGLLVPGFSGVAVEVSRLLDLTENMGSHARLVPVAGQARQLA